MLRAIELGHRNQDEAEVEGLAPGEQVVVHPSDRIAAGVEVVAR